MSRHAALLLAVAAWPGPAVACAACARDGGALAWLWIGALVASPYLVAGLAAVALWRAGVRP